MPCNSAEEDLIDNEAQDFFLDTPLSSSQIDALDLADPRSRKTLTKFIHFSNPVAFVFYLSSSSELVTEEVPSTNTGPNPTNPPQVTPPGVLLHDGLITQLNPNCFAVNLSSDLLNADMLVAKTLVGNHRVQYFHKVYHERGVYNSLSDVYGLRHDASVILNEVLNIIRRRFEMVTFILTPAHETFIT